MGWVCIAITFGIVVSAMIYVFGNISGAHINPSLTIALVTGKLISIKEAILYILFQILGALLASILLKLMFSENRALGATIPSGGLFQSFILTLILTFFLMLTILGVTSKNNFLT